MVFLHLGVLTSLWNACATHVHSIGQVHMNGEWKRVRECFCVQSFTCWPLDDPCCTLVTSDKPVVFINTNVSWSVNPQVSLLLFFWELLHTTKRKSEHNMRLWLWSTWPFNGVKKQWTSIHPLSSINNLLAVECSRGGKRLLWKQICTQQFPVFC